VQASASKRRVSAVPPPTPKSRRAKQAEFAAGVTATDADDEALIDLTDAGVAREVDTQYERLAHRKAHEEGSRPATAEPAERGRTATEEHPARGEGEAPEEDDAEPLALEGLGSPSLERRPLSFATPLFEEGATSTTILGEDAGDEVVRQATEKAERPAYDADGPTPTGTVNAFRELDAEFGV